MAGPLTDFMRVLPNKFYLGLGCQTADDGVEQFLTAGSWAALDLRDDARDDLRARGRLRAQVATIAPGRFTSTASTAGVPTSIARYTTSPPFGCHARRSASPLPHG